MLKLEKFIFIIKDILNFNIITFIILNNKEIYIKLYSVLSIVIINH